MNAIEWGKWARENSDKYLVAIMMALLLLYNLHVMHHEGDKDQLQFTNALVNNLQGAFLTLVTGAVLRKTTTTAETKDQETGKAVSTATIQQEDK